MDATNEARYLARLEHRILDSTTRLGLKSTVETETYYLGSIDITRKLRRGLERTVSVKDLGLSCSSNEPIKDGNLVFHCPDSEAGMIYRECRDQLTFMAIVVVGAGWKPYQWLDNPAAVLPSPNAMEYHDRTSEDQQGHTVKVIIPMTLAQIFMISDQIPNLDNPQWSERLDRDVMSKRCPKIFTRMGVSSPEDYDRYLLLTEDMAV